MFKEVGFVVDISMPAKSSALQVVISVMIYPRAFTIWQNTGAVGVAVAASPRFKVKISFWNMFLLLPRIMLNSK
jgi:hypothetical protein